MTLPVIDGEDVKVMKYRHRIIEAVNQISKYAIEGINHFEVLLKDFELFIEEVQSICGSEISNQLNLILLLIVCHFVFLTLLFVFKLQMTDM